MKNILHLLHRFHTASKGVGHGKLKTVIYVSCLYSKEGELGVVIIIRLSGMVSRHPPIPHPSPEISLLKGREYQKTDLFSDS